MKFVSTNVNQSSAIGTNAALICTQSGGSDPTLGDGTMQVTILYQIVTVP